jgi:hypothetical protein
MVYMKKPTEICETCFQKNRITHKADDGYELVGMFCSHTRTGAQAIRCGEIVSPWSIHPRIGMAEFYAMLRLTARFHRGEITKGRLAIETMALAKAHNGAKRPRA